MPGKEKAKVLEVEHARKTRAKPRPGRRIRRKGGQLLRASYTRLEASPPPLPFLPRIAGDGDLLVTVGSFWWAPELALDLLLQPWREQSYLCRDGNHFCVLGTLQLAGQSLDLLCL